MRRLTQKELLEKYQTREPNLFVQIDALKTEGERDNLMQPDEDGVWVQARHTCELMEGAAVSVFIHPRTDRKDAVLMLKKILIKMDQDGFSLLKETKSELQTAQGIEGIANSLIRIQGFEMDDFEQLARVAKEKFANENLNEKKKRTSNEEGPFW